MTHISSDFARKASEQLLTQAASIEKSNKANPLVQELAHRILSENLLADHMEISFQRGEERVIVSFSKDGDLLKYARTGKGQTVDYDRTPPELKGLASKYTWTSFGTQELSANESYSITLPKTALYAAGAATAAFGTLAYLGLYTLCANLGLGLISATAVDKFIDVNEGGRLLPKRIGPKVSQKTVLKTGAAIGTAGMLFGPLGGIFGTVFSLPYFGDVRCREDIQNAANYVKKKLKEAGREITPAIKKTGQILMDKTRITVQQTNPKENR